jgi:hypothetical protein
MLLNRKFKKGASLIEVLIVLGVISTVFVSAMTLLSSSIIQVVGNEIEDAANLTLVQGIEIIKSPTEVIVSEQPTTVDSYYALVKNPASASYVYNLVKQTGGVMTDCSTQSPYIISNLLDLGYGEVEVCLQAQIRQVRVQDNKPVYEIVTRIFYYVNGTLRGNYLKGYRYDAFSTQ